MTTSRMLFLNLAVTDAAASRAFFEGLGFAVQPDFSDERTTCLVISDQAYVMLLEHERFGDFATTPPADTATSTGAIVAVSAPTREEVDELADAALAAGATKATEPQDHGFMYGRSFKDLDGHHWEVMWMQQ